jgi:excisionase family DNA binding protein
MNVDLSSAPALSVVASAAARLTYTVEEAATALGISRGLAYAMVREGRLPALRLGQRRLIIPRAALEGLLDLAPKLAASEAPGWS